MFVWKRTFVRHRKLDGNYEYARATLRLACVVIPAVLVTVWALLDGVAYRNRAEAAALAGDGAGAGDRQREARSRGSGSRAMKAHSVAGSAEEADCSAGSGPRIFLAKGTTKPLIIRFDAPYWYFQPPEKRPGPNAFQAHGTPLVADIQANDFIPLFMEAHQQLGSSIRSAAAAK